MRTLVSDESGLPLLRADMPWLADHTLAFRNHAYEAVRSYLEPSGRFLPLDLADAPDRFWLFRADLVVDALDESASNLVRFPSTGRVMDVERHVFDPDKVAVLERIAAFRVPQLRTLFLTAGAVKVMADAKLTGTSFELVWEPESGGALQV